ncbi:MAG: 16S rRNA (cytosine(1402)-N(4))-methyltransferase RsmH [Planctomycetota bacterium]|nr:16S rRNA (cytosine(1402)-N(4))-methyltransferase RsmH [Planctomycetota bacterium]
MAPGSDDLSHVHEPVLVQEVLAFLALERSPGGLVVDGTVGAGGHAAAILRAHPDVRLLGIDRDPAILTHAAQRLAPFGDRVRLVHRSYAELAEVLAEAGESAPAGVLLDVGVSSLQLDDPSRGFSFRGGEHAPDMRFDSSSSDATAGELINHASERNLARILFELGDEPRARSVARAIVAARPITTVAQLREVVARSALRVRRHDPATRTFQALRIAVNDELGHMERGLDVALRQLATGGRLVVLCFQSAEERLVKTAFREAARERRGRILTKKPVRATSEEVRRNPRARPARLRAFEAGSNEEREGS